MLVVLVSAGGGLAVRVTTRALSSPAVFDPCLPAVAGRLETLNLEF
jgi:hypothetical protein